MRELIHKDSKLCRHERESAWAFSFVSDESKVQVYTPCLSYITVELNTTTFLTFASIMPRDLTFHCSNDVFPSYVPGLSRIATTTTTTAAPTAKSFKEEMNKNLTLWLKSLLTVENNLPTDATSHPTTTTATPTTESFKEEISKFLPQCLKSVLPVESNVSTKATNQPTEITDTTSKRRTIESFDQVIKNFLNNSKGMNMSISDMRHHEQKTSHLMGITTTVAIILATSISAAVFIVLVVMKFRSKGKDHAPLKVA